MVKELRRQGQSTRPSIHGTERRHLIASLREFFNKVNKDADARGASAAVRSGESCPSTTFIIFAGDEPSGRSRECVQGLDRLKTRSLPSSPARGRPCDGLRSPASLGPFAIVTACVFFGSRASAPGPCAQGLARSANPNNAGGPSAAGLSACAQWHISKLRPTDLRRPSAHLPMAAQASRPVRPRSRELHERQVRMQGVHILAFAG